MGYLVAMKTYGQSMCGVHFEIDWYKMDDFRKHAKMQVTQKRCVVCHGGWIRLIGLFIRNICMQTTRLPVEMILMTLTLTFVILVVTQSRHEVRESPCEVS